MAGKNHLSSWYENSPLPYDWVIAVTANGWTTNERGLDWIQHFDRHTKSRTKGKYGLLVFDGHESHHSTDFELYCKENNVITLCMPPHSSHRLQPLDIGCFRALKRSYGTEIEKLMRSHITHISKEDFFSAFYIAFRTAMTESNIRGGFRGSGLVPYDPDYVISQLDVQVSGSSQPTTASSLPLVWQPRTPKNVIEAHSQLSYVRVRIVRHQSSSPTAILHGFDQFAKGAKLAIHEIALLRAENAALRDANNRLSRRRRTKKRRLQDAQDLQAQNNPQSQLQVVIEQSSDYAKPNPPPRRHCKKCGEHGHNARTCQNRVKIAKDSDSNKSN